MASNGASIDRTCSPIDCYQSPMQNGWLHPRHLGCSSNDFFHCPSGQNSILRSSYSNYPLSFLSLLPERGGEPKADTHIIMTLSIKDETLLWRSITRWKMGNRMGHTMTKVRFPGWNWYSISYQLEHSASDIEEVWPTHTSYLSTILLIHKASKNKSRCRHVCQWM